jgi:NAD(P)-dependent dehydrogenase (short-subunit alcohol dehydrogenase family)
MMLQGKGIAVTGGFGILGRAVGEAALAAGASVALIGHGPVPQDLPKQDRLLTIGEIDLSDYALAARAFETVAATFGKIDGLANVAGGFKWQTLDEGEVSGWLELFRMNLLTAVTATKAALPFLRAAQGAIVNVSAAPARKAGSGMGAYAASKAGVLSLTQSAAEELKAAGIRVNAILPMIIDTPRNRADMPKADHSKWVTPEEIARVILFLLSDEAKAVTGAEILVAGKT